MRVQRGAALRRWQFLQGRGTSWRASLFGSFLALYGASCVYLALTDGDLAIGAFGGFLFIWGLFMIWVNSGRRAQLPVDPECINCGYDMRGSPSGRCPECGHRG